jgi:uncharacterized protein (DUF488 family)
MSTSNSQSNGAAQPASGHGALYTIGYGSRSLQEFIALLQSFQIDQVLDVRTAPYSRFKPEFSKESLENALKNRRIDYLFMGQELGGQPKDPDCYTNGKVDYDKVRTAPFFQSGLARLKELTEQSGRPALLCSEGRPEECHRSKLIGEALAAEGIPMWHIDETGILRTHGEVIDRLTGGQMDLFGQPAFQSRKRYLDGGQ